MNEFQLKYGTNPNQKPARIYMADGSDLPVQILNGRPGYINFLDAFNSWQLVRDLKKALGQPAAASFKHVSPAGAAIGLPLDETLRAMYHIAPETELSPLACAYARARGADRMSSFGDWIALSDVCDLSTAKLIQHEVSDGIIAPGYDADALEVLKSKKKGGYAIVQIDADYEPKPLETRTVFGVTFEQGRQDLDISNETMLQNVVTENKVISDEQRRDLIISLIVLKYTQSNSVCYVQDGQTIGVGAGQQSHVLLGHRIGHIVGDAIVGLFGGAGFNAHFLGCDMNAQLIFRGQLVDELGNLFGAAVSGAYRDTDHLKGSLEVLGASQQTAEGTHRAVACGTASKCSHAAWLYFLSDSDSKFYIKYFMFS